MLLDNGRTDVLADEVGRQALHCIRCSACLNVCPVYDARRRPGLRVGLSRPDRRDPHAAAARARPGADAAVGLVAVRRVLRGLPGQDRHPVACSSTCAARVVREEKSALAPEALAMERDRHGVRLAQALRARAAARAGSAAARSGRGCRPCRAGRAMRDLPEVARADVPGLVA